jgi:hypothetical protein
MYTIHNPKNTDEILLSSVSIEHIVSVAVVWSVLTPNVPYIITDAEGTPVKLVMNANVFRNEGLDK